MASYLPIKRTNRWSASDVPVEAHWHTDKARFTTGEHNLPSRFPLIAIRLLRTKPVRIVARLLLLLPLLWAEGVWAVDCPDYSYTLTSQASWALGATGYRHILGDLSIYDLPDTEFDITNLNGLANITSVGGSLWVQFTDSLANVDGLIGLTSVGDQCGSR